MNTKRYLIIALLFGSVLIYGWSQIVPPTSMQTGNDYPVYGGNKFGNRYSPLKQITAANVKNLEVAWMYDAAPTRKGDIQCQPIVVNGVLYATTPDGKVFALDGATGKELWKFTPTAPGTNQNRGVMYWENGSDKRIIYSMGPNIYAVNAQTGQGVQTFGTAGRVDLHEGLQTNMDYDVTKYGITATSPGVIYKNILIIGSSLSESGNAIPGHIRAFDVVTGKLLWVFHTIPQPGEFGYDTWPKDAYKNIGATNSWNGMVLDEKRGAVYFGTGSPASDFYGGAREGANLFATCIMSLNATTGKMNWYYQTIHHDLWDRDHPCPPNLTTVMHNGKKVDVVVQATKDGLVYVLDRDKGTSLFPVVERPVPTNGLPGEHPYPTQKYPTIPAPFVRQMYTEKDISDLTPETYAYVKERFDKIHSDNKFTPPSTTGTLLFGYSGGAEWGGNAIDPSGILYQTGNEDPWELIMAPGGGRNRAQVPVTPGNALYLTNCASCHGTDRRGSGPEQPSLVNIGTKYKVDEIKTIIASGKARMPAFAAIIPEADRDKIISFLTGTENTTERVTPPVVASTTPVNPRAFPYQPAYSSSSWRRFTDQNGYPGIKPPWGTFSAINLNTGKYLWKIPLGEFPELTKKGVPITGTVIYGGPVVTGSGLIFIGGTKDQRFRAIDKKTGKIVWEYQLPAGGLATPVTYQVNGKQYVVIAAGGGRGPKSGNYIAFALKQP